MKRRILSLLSGVMMCLALVAQTNDSQKEMRLSLAEARDYALEHNRTLQNADLSVRQAYATRWQTIASMLPQADMSLGLNYTDGKMKFSLQEGMPPMEKNIENLAGSLNVSASIAVNGQLIMGALINNTAIEMQDINKRNSELDVVSNVETYYITALAMEKTVGLLDKSMVDLEKLYEITENSVKAGV
jgi:outer membrane protein TolC